MSETTKPGMSGYEASLALRWEPAQQFPAGGYSQLPLVRATISRLLARTQNLRAIGLQKWQRTAVCSLALSLRATAEWDVGPHAQEVTDA